MNKNNFENYKAKPISYQSNTFFPLDKMRKLQLQFLQDPSIKISAWSG